MKGSITPLKALWEDGGPHAYYQVTCHNEWGVVYVVNCNFSEHCELTLHRGRVLGIHRRSFGFTFISQVSPVV